MSSEQFLGFDLSTQQLKAIIISQDTTVIHESAVHFDKDLPQYNTINGALLGPGSGEVTSPVAMWLDAIDLLMVRMKQAGVDFRSISAISGAGQVRSLTQSMTAPYSCRLATWIGLLVEGCENHALIS